MTYKFKNVSYEFSRSSRKWKFTTTKNGVTNSTFVDVRGKEAADMVAVAIDAAFTRTKGKSNVDSGARQKLNNIRNFPSLNIDRVMPLYIKAEDELPMPSREIVGG